ncbi:hypothetical protein [Butyrivibrio sp. YAB3001]|uniref:hypothetical protein n=1 Tax=Butyrivibrio sp. YAB3001 TaxID=1520812 RepID=UPI0008F64290|nr:hypothetical protein [Butyrivibrio sp. YAB3001]SFC61628.1 hypothetical protein SAMN02910398_02709 [Butyrivibrio sp. YAB3001]
MFTQFKTIKYRFIILMAAFISVLSIGYFNSVTASAEEQQGNVSISGKLATLNSDADGRESADANAAVVESFRAGDTVYMIDSSDGWVTIYYHSQYLYLQDTDGKLISLNDTTDLVNEMELREQTDRAWIDAYNSQLKAMRNAKVWRIAIVAIIVFLIGFIVYKGVKQNNQKTPEKKDK